MNTRIDWTELSAVAHRWARRAGRQHQDDVAQQALLKVWERQPKTRERALSLIRSWIGSALTKLKREAAHNSRGGMPDVAGSIAIGNEDGAPVRNDDGAEYRHGLPVGLVDFLIRYYHHHTPLTPDSLVAIRMANQSISDGHFISAADVHYALEFAQENCR